MCLEVKMQQATYDWWISSLKSNNQGATEFSKVKWQKNRIRQRYLKVVKEQEKHGWSVWMLKYNKQSKIAVFKAENATSQLQIMYFEVEMQQIRYCISHLKVKNLQERYGWFL